MLFEDVIGNEPVKKFFQKNSVSKRVAHCQLIVGSEGSGALPMALAYARSVICNNSKSPDSSCNLRISEIKHPDLHFIFPVANNQKVKSKSISSHFISSWREFLYSNPYGSLFDWYSHIGIENKQGKIGKDEAENLISKISLKPYEGGWKAVIVWMAEKMNASATNKLLKLIEEPPEKTLFLFITEDESLLMDTLLSRCQKTYLKRIPNSVVLKSLKNKGFSEKVANNACLQSNGNYGNALSLAKGQENTLKFEEWFKTWLRSAFTVKKNKEAVLDLLEWSKTIAKSGRETQKRFIDYSLELFRQALMVNYGLKKITYFSPSSDFNFESFSNYIEGANIEEISDELEKAYFQVQSNGNPNMIFTDLSLKLTRLIHRVKNN